MFNTRVDSLPPFIGGNFFPENVSGSSYKDDQSMVATLRGLLFGRIGAEESFTVHNYSATCSHIIGKSKNSSKKIVFESHIPFRNANDLVFLDVTGSIEEADVVMKLFHEHFEAYSAAYNGAYKEQTDISAYLMQKVDVRTAIFVDETTNRALVVVHGLDMKLWHLMQSFITRYLPGYFREKPLQPEEKIILRALTNRTSSVYIEAMNNLAERSDIRSVVLRSTLMNFERQQRKMTFENAENKLREVENHIREVAERYRMRLEERERAIIAMEGARVLMERQAVNHELYDYFSTRKNVDLVAAEGNVLKLIISNFLDVYDPDIYARFAANGDIYRNYEGIRVEEFRDANNRKLLMDHIFSAEPDLRIKICGYYSLDLRGYCSSSSGYHYPAKYHDHMPNPHLDRHNCLGSYEPAINECLRDGNLIGAIEQCNASVMSVNMAETGMTFRPMLAGLFNQTEKVLRNKEGIDMTPAEALAWLKSKGEK